MSLGFLTINFHRPQILRLFCASIRRLRYDTGIDLPVICVSEAEDAKVCSEYNIGHITYPNTPVSEKWNVGCRYLRELGVTWVTVLGSDDIMSSECLLHIIDKIDLNVDNIPQITDLVGIKQLYVYDTDGPTRGTLKYVTSKSFFGPAKTISKRVLDAVDWNPWKYHAPRNYGMDSIMHRNISEHIKTTATVEGMVVDCKSYESLNKFTMFQNNHHGVNVPKSLFHNILSKEERDILDSIKYNPSPIKFERVNKRGRTLI
jgi:hypothetical protein